MFAVERSEPPTFLVALDDGSGEIVAASRGQLRPGLDGQAPPVSALGRAERDGPQFTAVQDIYGHPGGQVGVSVGAVGDGLNEGSAAAPDPDALFPFLPNPQFLQVSDLFAESADIRFQRGSVAGPCGPAPHSTDPDSPEASEGPSPPPPPGSSVGVSVLQDMVRGLFREEAAKLVAAASVAAGDRKQHERTDFAPPLALGDFMSAPLLQPAPLPAVSAARLAAQEARERALGPLRRCRDLFSLSLPPGFLKTKPPLRHLLLLRTDASSPTRSRSQVLERWRPESALDSALAEGEAAPRALRRSPSQEGPLPAASPATPDTPRAGPVLPLDLPPPPPPADRSQGAGGTLHARSVFLRLGPAH